MGWLVSGTELLVTLVVTAIQYRKTCVLQQPGKESHLNDLSPNPGMNAIVHLSPISRHVVVYHAVVCTEKRMFPVVLLSADVRMPHFV